jgi:hypothetical protein
MKFWIEWEAIYEGFTYSEAVTEKELANRLLDSTIRLTHVSEIVEEP